MWRSPWAVPGPEPDSPCERGVAGEATWGSVHASTPRSPSGAELPRSNSLASTKQRLNCLAPTSALNLGCNNHIIFSSILDPNSPEYQLDLWFISFFISVSPLTRLLN